MNDDCSILRTAGTAAISDVFDTLKIEPPVLDNDLFSLGEAKAFAGPAYTITGQLVEFEGGDRAKLQAIDDMPEGVVALWAGLNARGVCCFGDLLGSAMKSRGCAGVIVDGGVRDVDILRNCGMPIMTRYRTPAQGIGRWKVTAAKVPVQVRGALRDWLTVHPGDMLVGDSDGVICVPQAMVTEVADKVRAWTQAESGARVDIADGMPLLAALAKHGHL